MTQDPRDHNVWIHDEPGRATPVSRGLWDAVKKRAELYSLLLDDLQTGIYACTVAPDDECPNCHEWRYVMQHLHDKYKYDEDAEDFASRLTQRGLDEMKHRND